MRNLFSVTMISIAMGTTALADMTSLKSALEATYANNPSLAETRATLRGLDENLVSARAGLRPSANGSYSANATHSHSSSTSGSFTKGFSQTVQLQVSQLIYDGGRVLGGINAAELALLAGRENLVAAEQQVLLNAITSFMDVRAAQATLNLAENNIRVLEEQVRASQDRFEVGEVTRTDVSQTQARLAAAISGRETSRAALQGQIANYVANVGEQPHSLMTPAAHPALPKTLAEAERRALIDHPRVTAAQFSVLAAEEDLKVAQKNRIPTVTGVVTGSIGDTSDLSGNFSSPDSSVSVGLNASIPLYQGGTLSSARRSAAASLETEQRQLQQAIATTKANLRTAYYNWEAAKAAITARQQQIRASKIAFEGVSEEAKVGARTTLDVLDAEQDLLSARSELVTALRDEQVRAYSVLSEMGALTAKTLGLNVELYDPKKFTPKARANSALGARRNNLLEKLEKRR
ncbi:transporter [Amylibacter marinus]|uniref:Transporter n=1 Tax=Amylibacter marinus TaxID=1475483 RepID=A0ABQ5VRP6_9RHOB|nr:TolC family outer membrane protein [Amylibacter marinus]GLQ33873.1 transporter [Amylibacter marinus]